MRFKNNCLCFSFIHVGMYMEIFKPKTNIRTVSVCLDRHILYKKIILMHVLLFNYIFTLIQLAVVLYGKI